MRKLIKGISLAAALGATVIGTTAPANARPWGWGGRHHHHYHGGDRAGLAIGAGLLGLAAGAAIASAGPRGYYGGGYYDYGYAPPPPPPPPPAYSYEQICRTYNQWDPYYGGYTSYRRCY